MHALLRCRWRPEFSHALLKRCDCLSSESAINLRMHPGKDGEAEAKQERRRGRDGAGDDDKQRAEPLP
jgi:hypothetical protein